jgi:hypothetical protein
MAANSKYEVLRTEVETRTDVVPAATVSRGSYDEPIQ